MLGLLIVVEGVRRLINPPDVEGGVVLVVALVGIAVNLAATWVLARANRQSLNVEGAFQHILTDLVGVRRHRDRRRGRAADRVRRARTASPRCSSPR